jgi:Tfp pilus assembly protein PilF
VGFCKLALRGRQKNGAGTRPLPSAAKRGWSRGLTSRLIIMTACSVLPALVAGCQLPIRPTTRVRPTTERSEGPRAAKAAVPMSDELPAKEAARLQLEVAERELKGGFDAEAKARFEQARRLDPNIKGAAHRLALIHDSLGEHALAQTEYVKALGEKPNDPDVLNDLGYSYYSQGAWKKAEETYRKALELGKNPRASNNLGLALAEQGRYREALASFRDATDEARAHGNLGFVFLTQGKRENARRAYQRALELDPSYELARNVLAQMDSNQPSALLGSLEPAPIATAGARRLPPAQPGQNVGRLPETVGAGSGPIVIPGPRPDGSTTAAPGMLLPPPANP